MRINGVDQTAGVDTASARLALRETWRGRIGAGDSEVVEWRLLADDPDGAAKTLAYGIYRDAVDWKMCAALTRDRWDSLQQEIDDFDDDNPEALAIAILTELLGADTCVPAPRGARKAFEKALVEWICDRRAAAFTAAVA